MIALGTSSCWRQSRHRRMLSTKPLDSRSGRCTLSVCFFSHPDGQAQGALCQRATGQCHGERASTPKAGRVVHGILPQKSRTVLERFTRRFKNRDVFRGALELLHNGPTSLATRQPAMLVLVSDAPAILPPTLHRCVTTEAHVTCVRACTQMPLTDAGSPRWNARGADSATAGQTTTP